jgi:hypothetical protein
MPNFSICVFFCFRFSKAFESSSLKVAAAIHPSFRLSWVRDEQERVRIANLVKAEVLTIERQLEGDGLSQQGSDVVVLGDDAAGQPVSPLASAFPRKRKPESVFQRFRGQKKVKTAIEQEVDYYLAQDADDHVASLKTKSMRLLFVKTNTALPSSAAIERIFSLGGRVFVPNRSRISDAHFEQLIFLRANWHLLISSQVKK